MRVGLNLLYLVPGETGGMETHARGLVPALAAAAPGVSFTAFVNREAAAAGMELGGGVETVLVQINARSRAQWVAAEQLRLPRLLARHRLDLLHSLASTSPALGRCARVTTIHDLIYHRFPEAHFGLRTLGMRVVVPLAARRSHRIITPSEQSARDIREFLGVPAGRIDVIHPGHGGPPMPGVGAARAEEARRRWSLGSRPVLLTLSAKRPVKNLPRLLQALAQIPVERRPVLVMPGYPTAHEEVLRGEVGRLALDEFVRMPGWIPDEEVEALWSVADAFVFPSLFEGFGAPVLEAMRRSVPVACSDRSSLPEVAGDAAILFDPLDVPAIAGAVERALDPAERELRVARGLAWAARFTWEAAAQQTLVSYEAALAAARS